MRIRIYKRYNKIHKLQNALQEILDKFPNNNLLDELDDDLYTGRRIITTYPEQHFKIKEIREYRKLLK